MSYDGLPSWYDRWRTSYPEPDDSTVIYECVDCGEEFKEPMPECPTCRGKVIVKDVSDEY